MQFPLVSRSVALCVLSVFFLVRGYSQSGNAPSWLLFLPQEEGAMYAVGFSYPYESPETTYARAYDNGIGELGRSFSVQIRSARIDWSENGDDELSYVDRVYGESVDSSLLERISGSARVVGTYREQGSRILYLLLRLPVQQEGSLPAPGSPEESANRTPWTSVIDPSAAPSWVTRLPVQEGSLFAVGFEERYADPTESRRRAIENARAELSRMVKLKVQTLLDAWSERNDGISSDVNERISRSLSAATLKGSQIVGMWVDPHTGETYALARMLRKPISLTVRREAAGRILSKRSGAQPGDVEHAAAKALEDLDNALKDFSSSNEDRP